MFSIHFQGREPSGEAPVQLIMVEEQDPTCGENTNAAPYPFLYVA